MPTNSSRSSGVVSRSALERAIASGANWMAPSPLWNCLVTASSTVWRLGRLWKTRVWFAIRRESRSGSMRQLPSLSCCHRLSLAVEAARSSAANWRMPALRRMLPATIVTAASSISRQHSTELRRRPIALPRIWATRP